MCPYNISRRSSVMISPLDGSTDANAWRIYWLPSVRPTIAFVTYVYKLRAIKQDKKNDTLNLVQVHHTNVTRPYFMTVSELAVSN